MNPADSQLYCDLLGEIGLVPIMDGDKPKYRKSTVSVHWVNGRLEPIHRPQRLRGEGKPKTAPKAEKWAAHRKPKPSKPITRFSAVDKAIARYLARDVAPPEPELLPQPEPKRRRRDEPRPGEGTVTKPTRKPAKRAELDDLDLKAMAWLQEHGHR